MDRRKSWGMFPAVRCGSTLSDCHDCPENVREVREVVYTICNKQYNTCKVPVPGRSVDLLVDLPSCSTTFSTAELVRRRPSSSIPVPSTAVQVVVRRTNLVRVKYLQVS